MLSAVWKFQCTQKCDSPQCLIRRGAYSLAAVEEKRLTDQSEEDGCSKASVGLGGRRDPAALK